MPLLGLLLLSCCAQSPVAHRLGGNPIITPQTSPTIGTNINGPSLIRVPGWVRKPLGKYYLYFAHHRGAYIRLAYADRVQGPWTVYEPGTIRLSDVPQCNDHIASPDVHADRTNKTIRMYFHCPAGAAGTAIEEQKTFCAESRDGLVFHAAPTVLGPAYMRVFRWKGRAYAVARTGVMLRSIDGTSPFESGPQLFQDPDGRVLRHAAVDLEGSTLRVYYSRIGDSPEAILVSEVDLKGDWRMWRSSAPRLVLAPDLPYEGSGLPIAPSQPDDAPEPVRQLRDPAILREQGKTYLLYSVAGENGIAVAEITEF